MHFRDVASDECLARCFRVDAGPVHRTPSCLGRTQNENPAVSTIIQQVAEKVSHIRPPWIFRMPPGRTDLLPQQEDESLQLDQAWGRFRGRGG